MIKNIQSSRFLTLTLLVLAAAATRALPREFPVMANFTAVGALAVFAGAQFKDKRLAFLVPLLAMAISDTFLGNGFSLVVYASFILMVACGVIFAGKKASVANVGIASLTGAVLFYLITNFAFLYDFYPHNFEGILTSYAAGLPFLRNMLIGDAFFGAILFGSFYLLERKFPRLAF
jgi:hypothetical protein